MRAMSRHGYSDDCDDNLAAGRWAGRLASAIRGKKGQAFLRELRDAMDAMPEKRLISEELVTADGDCCALGCVAKARGLDVSKVDPEEPDVVAGVFGITEVLACEVAYQNDEAYPAYHVACTPELRWKAVRRWLDEKIKPDPQPA
jgi:hypothetical protein